MSRKLIDYFRDIGKILELAKKPEREEFKQIFKLVLLGFIIIGATSFGIALLITMIFDMFGIGLKP